MHSCSSLTVNQEIYENGLKLMGIMQTNELAMMTVSYHPLLFSIISAAWHHCRYNGEIAAAQSYSMLFDISSGQQVLLSIA
jgi:hypothetical protein